MRRIFGILTLLQALIAANFGVLALLYVLIAKHFGILALFPVLTVDNCGIFSTLGKNKHHPGLVLETSCITSPPLYQLHYQFLEHTVYEYIKTKVEYLYKFTVNLLIKLYRLILIVHIYNRRTILMWWRKIDEHKILSTSFIIFIDSHFYFLSLLIFFFS